MTRVRLATEDDLEPVRSVGLLTWPATYTRLIGAEQVAAGLDRWWSPQVVRRGILQHTTWVAQDGDDIVGCAVAGLREDQLWLWKLYVVPRSNGTGAGHALLDAVLAWAGDRPVRLTHLVGNDHAHAFYARHGFADVGTEGEGPAAEVVMERRPARPPR